MEERSRSAAAHTFTAACSTNLRRTVPTVSIQQHILIGWKGRRKIVQCPLWGNHSSGTTESCFCG